MNNHAFTFLSLGIREMLSEVKANYETKKILTLDVKLT